MHEARKLLLTGLKKNNKLLAILYEQGLLRHFGVSPEISANPWEVPTKTHTTKAATLSTI